MHQKNGEIKQYIFSKPVTEAAGILHRQIKSVRENTIQSQKRKS